MQSAARSLGVAAILAGLAPILTSCGPTNPCSTRHVVQTKLGGYAPTTMNASVGRLRIVQYELDDGHVYDRHAMEWAGNPSMLAITGATPITSYLLQPGSTVELCEERSKIDNSQHFSLAMTNQDGKAERAVVTQEP